MEYDDPKDKRRQNRDAAPGAYGNRQASVANAVNATGGSRNPKYARRNAPVAPSEFFPRC